MSVCASLVTLARATCVVRVGASGWNRDRATVSSDAHSPRRGAVGLCVVGVHGHSALPAAGRVARVALLCSTY